MSKQGKNTKYNPNTTAFVPSSSSSSLSTQQNMSSHSAPPPVNPKARQKPQYSKGGNKPRETRSYTQNSKASATVLDYDDDDFTLHLDDEMAISGGNHTRARRGQISINHLLDFSLPSREADAPSSRPQQARRRRRSSNKDHDKIHLSGKEFVNANYRFVVDYRWDYNGQAMDPNLLLDKAQILRVIVPKGHHCPICLTEEIVAPRMISCGHLFCHACLLSFLDSESLEQKKKQDANVYVPKKLKECPLCSQLVKPEETLPVLVNDTDERFEIPKIGQDVVLKLMARPYETILPIPRSLNLNHTKIGNTPWYSDTEVYPYARIMKGGLKFISDCYEKDKASILSQYEEDKLLFNDDGKYVHRAIAEIDMYLDVMNKSYGSNFTEPNPLVTSMNNLSISKQDSGLDDTNCYFFYETAFNSTTRYFLSPLDVKVLLRTYGSYADFPTTLLMKVDNINYGYMVTEQTVKRYKYMAHLPFGTEFAFIDVNWKNMLPPEIYKMFSKELTDRRRKLLAKLKKEDHAKRTYETELDQKTKEFYMQENQGWGSYEFLSSQEQFGLGSNDANFAEQTTPSLHPLGDDELEGHEGEGEEDKKTKDYTTTVWGTQIPKSSLDDINAFDDGDDDPFNTEELLKFALSKDESQTGKKKKGRKKLIVLSSSGQSRDYK